MRLYRGPGVMCRCSGTVIPLEGVSAPRYVLVVKEDAWDGSDNYRRRVRDAHRFSVAVFVGHTLRQIEDKMLAFQLVDGLKFFVLSKALYMNHLDLIIVESLLHRFFRSWNPGPHTQPQKRQPKRFLSA